MNAKKLFRKPDSPVGEVITTSDYFATSGKSKPARSTPSKPKPSCESKTMGLPSRTASAKSTPAGKATAKSTMTQNGRSSRKVAVKNYSEGLDDESGGSDFDPKVIKEDENSGEDIFGAEYKGGKIRAMDDYQSDEDEDEDVKPALKKVRRNKDVPIKDEDLEMKDLNPPTKPIAKAVSGIKTSTSRKRKSVELSDDEDQDDVVARGKRASATRSKSTPKKPAAKKSKKNEEEDARAEVQDIFDSIPTVKAPTPPPRDTSKKFNYHAHAQNAQPTTASESAELPIGAENCLAGLTFVFTGVLSRLGRDQGIELVKQYGGKVTGGPSKKTSYVVIGSDAGPKKLETIASYNLKTINEEGLFELIRRLPANGGDSKAAGQFKEKQEKEAKKVEEAAKEMIKQEKKVESSTIKGAGMKTPIKNGALSSLDIDNQLWTVKYAPSSMSMICGNKGQVEKLQRWLRAWPSNAKTNFKKPGPDMSGIFRAICIHGPPGIGKTTAAHLVARMEGYDVLESNASDTRSKKLVETGLKGVLDSTSLLGYFAGDGKKVEAQNKKMLLIMDEVDGMSAGDRGGVGALASVCKKTHIPMILICNDRKLPKMKPFDHVTFDLPFRKPTNDQVRARIMTICYREGLQIPPNVINALIEGSRADIRQIINMLSTAKLDQTAMDFDQGKAMSKAWEKHVILRPWDIASKILGGGLFASSSTSTLNDKIELYFNDHEWSSLMLQENYLGTNPMLSNGYNGKEKNLKMLELSDKAAESISDGDLVDRLIHGSQQQWSLMPTHAVFSFVRPASFISGSQAGNQTRFTSWLGNNSKQGMELNVFYAILLMHCSGKMMRYIKEIQGHMRLRASGDRHEIRQQYLPLLWYRLVKDLQSRGKDIVEEVIELMDSYYLTKDDWDAILELAVGDMDMEKVKIESQTKATFTRLYNQQPHPMPFIKASQIVAPKNLKKVKPDLEEAIDESDENDAAFIDSDAGEQEDEEEALDLKKDKFVQVPKAKKVTAKKMAEKKTTTAKRKKSKESGEDEAEEESEEDVKPKKGRPKGATKGKGRK